MKEHKKLKDVIDRMKKKEQGVFAKSVCIYRDDNKNLISSFKSIRASAKFFMPYASIPKFNSLLGSISKSRSYNPATSMGLQKRIRFFVQIDGVSVKCFATKNLIQKK